MKLNSQQYISSTPILTGDDADKLIISIKSPSTQASVDRNLFELSILKKIRRRSIK